MLCRPLNGLIHNYNLINLDILFKWKFKKYNFLKELINHINFQSEPILLSFEYKHAIYVSIKNLDLENEIKENKTKLHSYLN